MLKMYTRQGFNGMWYWLYIYQISQVACSIKQMRNAHKNHVVDNKDLLHFSTYWNHLKDLCSQYQNVKCTQIDPGVYQPIHSQIHRGQST